MEDHSDIEYQTRHRSCLLRIFHFLVYHHKFNLKKLVPPKNNPTGRRRNKLLCCQGPKTISLEREIADQNQQNDDKVDETAATRSPKAVVKSRLTYVPSPIIILKGAEAGKDDAEPKRRREASDSTKDALEVIQVNTKFLLDIFPESKTASSSYPKRKIVRSGSFPVEKPSTLESKMRETFPQVKLPSESDTNSKMGCSPPKTRSRKTSPVVSYVMHLKKKIKRALKQSDAIVESGTGVIRATSHREFLENCKQLLERSENYSWILRSGSGDRLIWRSSSLKTYKRKVDVDYLVHYDVSGTQTSCEMQSAKLNAGGESQNEEQSPSSVLETRFPEESMTKGSEEEEEENLESEAIAVKESNGIEDPEEKYIGELLYVSGFVEGENATKWHTMREPMDPRLYNDVEAIMYDEEGGDRREVFDAVNEALVEIFERAMRYFPAEMCAPRGPALVRHVCRRLKNMRECRGPEIEPWMNLIYDVEDVALDVEDVIFDDLLHDTVLACIL